MKIGTSCTGSGASISRLLIGGHKVAKTPEGKTVCPYCGRAFNRNRGGFHGGQGALPQHKRPERA